MSFEQSFEENGVKKFWRSYIKPPLNHFWILTWKNFILSLRNYKASLVQLISPIAVVLLIIFVQLIANIVLKKTNEHPDTYDVPKFIDPCTPGKNDSCFNLIYAPKGVPWVEKLLKNIALENNLDFNSRFLGIGDPPSSFLDFFKDNETMTEFMINNQNTTNYGMIFLSPYINSSFRGEDIPNELGYWLFYNETLNMNSTANFITSIDRHAAQLKTNGKPVNITVHHKSFPQTLYRVSQLDIASTFGGTVFYIPPTLVFFALLIEIVEEKELKLRIGMRMMGLSNTAYWISWYLKGLIFTILTTIILYLSGVSARFSFFTNSNVFAVAFLFIEFGLAMISVAALFSVLIKSSKTAQTVGYGVILIGIVFQSIFTSGYGALLNLLWVVDAPGWVSFVRFLLCLYPPFNMAKAYSDIAAKSATILSITEGRFIEGPGFKWSDLYKDTPLKIGTIEMLVPAPSQSYLWLLFDIFLFSLLTWYLDNVLAGDHGSPRPFYFPFTAEYWGIRRKKSKMESIDENDNLIDDDYDSDVNEEREISRKQFYNLEESDCAVNIYRLEKVYKKYSCCKSKKDYTAVKDLCMTIKVGEIFCLLGHNGAGKTTTINIITGLYNATSGYANVFGYDVKENIEEVQRIIGVCPQYDILWENLTASEHLKLFCKLKQIPNDEIENEIHEKLEMVGLLDVKNSKVKSFSGGMKRRLSIAISSIGTPKLIILDEPTSGLDPLTKTSIWKMIQNIKKDKAIILTTHSMEEAEVLANRIGIMAYGKLRAIGDPLHLKTKYGDGYKLNLVTEIHNSEKIINGILERSSNISVTNNDAGSLCFNIPRESNELIPSLLEDIESNPLVKEWGISHSTLESVFLKVTKQHNFVYDNIDVGSDVSDSEQIDIDELSQPLLKQKPNSHKSYPFRALFRKNLSLLKRQYFSNCCQIFTPVLIILIIVLLKVIIKSQMGDSGDPKVIPGIPIALNLQAALYNSNLRLDNSDVNFQVSDTTTYKNLLLYEWNKKFQFSNSESQVIFDEPPVIPPSDKAENDTREYNCLIFMLYTDLESNISAGHRDMYGNGSGMLGEVLQNSCEIEIGRDDKNNSITKEIMIPFFNLRNTTYEIEEEIVDYIKFYNNHSLSDIQKPPYSYLLPDGHFNVHNVNYDKLELDFTMSVNDHITKYYHRRNNFTRLDIRLFDFTPTSPELIIKQGYLQLLNMLNRGFVKYSLKKIGIDITPISEIFNLIIVQPMPTLKPMNIWILLDFFCAILYPLGLTLQLPLYLYMITLEKFNRLREMMLIHGMKIWQYHITNYIFFYALYTLVFAAFWITGAASSTRFFTETHWSTLLVFFIGWGFSLVSIAFFISTFTNTPEVSSLLGYVIVMLGGILAIIVNVGIYGPFPISLTSTYPYWLYIWPQFTLSRSIYLMNSQCGLKNFCYGPITQLSWSDELSKAILALYLSGIFYLLLFLYFDAVMPRQYGVPKHPLFFLKFLRRNKLNKAEIDDDITDFLENKESIDVKEERIKINSGNYDPNTPLVISNLRKVYKNGKEALKRLSLLVKDGECFGLLGENGAGKTTTISILTGIIKPTSGWAKLGGYEIKEQMDKIHLITGICPQFDILWTDLTVLEHILFYSRMKGIDSKNEKEHAERILREVGLYASRNKLTSELSGGMRRRLSIAISLVGDSKIVFMDEPTTGLDPSSRRQIWKIIQRAKKGRAIVLTTHAMDEAELLCTRVGIMANGIMRVLGNIQHLKNDMGEGYRLVVNINTSSKEVKAFIQSLYSNAKMVNKYNKTIEFHLPLDASISKIFKVMETQSKNHGITDWSISQIGLIDVFQRVISLSRAETIDEEELRTITTIQ